MKYSKYLFNFSSSAEGGGLKRLLAYFDWFENNGGANFIVHEKLRSYFAKVSFNKVYFVNVSRFKKFINSQTYVSKIIDEIGGCDFYYSYNIPLNCKITANVKWFHLSNVLPLLPMRNYNIPAGRKVELRWLGKLIKSGLPLADFVSAESKFSLSLLNVGDITTKILSVNGADGELQLYNGRKLSVEREDTAVIVGTYYHKNLVDSYKVFLKLCEVKPGLKLIILGPTDFIPQSIRNAPGVHALGKLSHAEVCHFLSLAKYYINTSQVENSWNGASEGVILAEESYLSDIPPHRELLSGEIINKLEIIGLKNNVFKVSGQPNFMEKLSTWNQIISDMFAQIEKKG